MLEEVCGSCCTELITTECYRMSGDEMLWTHVIREAFWASQRMSHPQAHFDCLTV